MRRAWLMLTVAASCFLAGCSASNRASESASLDGSAWVLAALPGRKLLADAVPTARFEAGRVVGSDGCNRFTLPYAARGATLEIGTRGAMTQMACAPETMQQAEAFMSALGGAHSYRVRGSELQLLGADGAVLSTFAAQSQTLAGTVWSATAINNGRQAVVSLVAGSKLSLSFGTDGRISGSAGCNSYSAAYQVEGNTLRFTPAAATRRMCAAPGVMEQEQAFLKALETVTTMSMEGKRLELRTAEGALAVTLERSPGS